MGYVTITQIFKQGGINGTAGSPNFLQSIDSQCVRVEYTDIQQGGLQGANFELVKPYEDTTNLVGGNWIYFGAPGGTLSSAAVAGASSLTVTGLGASPSDSAQSDILANDFILISDGTHTDLMKVSSVSGSGSTWTVNLAAAPGQNTATLLNSYAANVTTVACLQYSGYLLARDTRTTELSNKYILKSQGFVTRYNNVLCNADIVKQDCANSIFQLVNSYAPTLPEIIVSSGNFAAANGVLGTAQAKDGQVMKVIADLLKTENSQKSNVNYSFWVDAARQAHHGTIPGANTATPSGNAGDPGTTHATPTYTIDIATPTNGTYNDSIGPLETKDMDMSQMVNTAKIIGGKVANSKQPLEIIVQDKTSQAAWGFWEGSFSNPDLTDQNAASQWGAGQLNISAYPRTTARFRFVSAAARLKCRDLLQVQGFTDGSIVQFNPVQITYVFDHRQRIVTGQADLAQMMPDIGSIMQQGASQHALRALHQASDTDLDLVFVVSGFGITTSGLTVTVAAGAVTYQGTLYNIPSWSYTMSANQVIEIGAQVAGTPPTGVTLPSVVQKPNVLGLTTMHALNVFSVTRPSTQGSPIALSQDTNFVGASLYRITALNGAISGTRDDRVFGGINAINLQTANFPAPTLTTTQVTHTDSVSGITQDVRVSANFGNVPTDGTANRIVWLIRTSGTTNWTPWAETSIPGLPSPAGSQVIGFTYQGVSNGGTYDYGCAYVSVRGDNAGAISTFVVGDVMPGWGKRLPATAPTFSVTAGNVAYTATSPNSYSVTVPFTATNQSSITGATGVGVFYTLHGALAPIINMTVLPLNANGSYTYTMPNISDSSSTYDVWASFMDVTGLPGQAFVIFTTSAFTAPPAGSGGTMPSGTVASATFVSNPLLNSWSNPYLVGINFTIPTAQTTALWLHDVKLVYQPLNYTFLTSAAAAAATTVTVNWPLPSGVAVGDTLTFTQGSLTETKTVSAIGTATTSVAGTQTNTITLSAGLTNSYSAYACQITGKLGTSWADAGKLPANSGGSYYGVWACPPYSVLAIQLIDYAGNPSGVSPVLFQVGAYRHTQGGTPQSGATGSTPNVISTGSLTYNNVGNGAYDALETVTFDGQGTNQNPWLQLVEYLISTNNSTTTLNGAVAKGATSIVLTSASGVNANDQITLDTGSSIEHVNVQSVSGATVTLQTPLQLAHATGVSVTTNTWKHFGYEAVNASGVYSLDWVSMGAGNVYQLGIRYVDTVGGVSFVVNVGQTAANPISIGTSNLKAMPSPGSTTFTVSAVSISVYNAGMRTL